MKFIFNESASFARDNDIALDDISITDGKCDSLLLNGIVSADTFAMCECTDAAGWRHHYTDGEIILSIKDNDDPTLNYVPSMVSQHNTSHNSSNLATTAGYVQPGVDYFWVMDRYWDVALGDANRQPSDSINVKFYFPDVDYVDVKDSIATEDSVGTFGLTAVTDLMFYKINGTHDGDPLNGHTTTGLGDWQEYSYSSTAATSSEWAYANLFTSTADHSAEMVVSGFSSGGGGGGNGTGGGALPFELIFFEATAEETTNARLKWTTVAEKNSDRFELLRSFDGDNFEHIATVNATGNTSTTQDYSYLDVNAGLMANQVYYKLRLVDQDDNFKFSTLKLVNFNGNELKNVSIAPNPFQNKFVVAFENSQKTEAIIEIKNLVGKEVYLEKVAPSRGRVYKTINAVELPAGIYLLSISANGNKTTQRVVKTK